MTIDERLEALTQTVELLVHDHEALTRDVKATGNYVNEIAQATARLLHIVQIHEHRLEKLEGSA